MWRRFWDAYWTLRWRFFDKKRAHIRDIDEQCIEVWFFADCGCAVIEHTMCDIIDGQPCYDHMGLNR